MTIGELNEMISNLIVEQCFWNLTTSLADLKVLLDEVVKGKDLEWSQEELKIEAFSNASKNFSPYSHGNWIVSFENRLRILKILQASQLMIVKHVLVGE